MRASRASSMRRLQLSAVLGGRLSMLVALMIPLALLIPAGPSRADDCICPVTPDGPPSLVVKAFDVEGSAIPGVIVRARASKRTEWVSAVTDPGGHAYLWLKKSGGYEVEASAPGFKPKRLSRVKPDSEVIVRLEVESDGREITITCAPVACYCR